MHIWLLRHGIAEVPSDAPDEERVLTDRGRKKLEARLPEYKRLIGEDPVIWSSPLIRARQTAEMLAEAYGGAEITIVDALADGDLESLHRALSHSDPSRSYVLVGHEPYLGQFHHVETGISFPLRVGALIGFEFSNNIE